tara:strand:+ start:134 stop:502 length:369 start_codon:yes stop_codon:yes gene_type:complete
MDSMKMFKPLPDFLKIDKSEIHGHGIFAKKDITDETNLGLSHILVDVPNIWVRTSLGGFVNHVEKDPNCVLIRDINLTHLFFIIAKRNIKAGEEITLTYTTYNPENEVDDYDTEFEEVKEEE